MNALFRKFAVTVATAAGRPWAFVLALTIILSWGLTGPIFGFSNTWQLMINTGTTIVTLLMVFLIQNTQNRDSKALHLKLDALVNNLKGTSHDRFVKVEEMPDDEIEILQERFRKLHSRYEKEMEKRKRKKK